MASSSSSSSSSSHPAFSSSKYDVFISFRGEDTRGDFISHLHDALCRNNIDTYVDYRLEKGEEVWPSLEKAIQDSILFLIVFSENYATSTWCLKELSKILVCSKEEGHHAIPVFYRINPSDIRKQKGSYEKAFREHEQRNPKEEVDKWRDALTQAANLSGWDSSTYGNEAKFIQDIVDEVLARLDLMDQSDYSDGLVGVQKQMAQVESMLKWTKESKDVRFIGIWGMGGIGKTTIANALFNKLCFAFESYCFLANVREEFDKFGIVHLKNRLLSTLLQGKESYKGMPDGGSTYVRRRLGRKKVLVVLDDVNDIEQLRNLAGSHNWFGQGSRVIITTRDKQLLGKNVDDVHKVKVLRSHQALQLFKMNAFEDNCCDEEFENLSMKVVDYAGGIPLAVIVLGNSLYGKDKNEWESQLEKLKKLPITKIQQILKLSYDGLDYEEQNIFLFVACFFKGWEAEHIKNLLDAYGYETTIGLSSLHSKALITLTPEEVSMHDLIQEMGLEIVRKESLEDPGKRSRLSDPNDIYQVLKDNKGSDTIKSITLDVSKVEDLIINPQVFAKMPNLSFLEIFNSNNSEKNGLYLPQGLEYLSNKLRYLLWSDYPLKSLPLTFSAENLVELRMPYSGMTELWTGVQNVVNLKEINLYGSKHLKKLPDFSKAINLKRVSLSYCTSINEVHPSILSLNKLESLRLNYCVSLTSLKSDTQLKSLNNLSLVGCSNLKDFSVTSESMEMLDLGGTAINELPSSIGHLSTLESLYLYNCKGMINMQSNLFDGLHSLRMLHLNDCCNIFEVVNHISLCSSLETLRIEESSLESLPESIKYFSSLQELELKKCKRLWFLPQLPPSLKSLLVLDCSSLKTVQFTSSVVDVAEVKGSNGNKFLTRFQCCLRLDQQSVKAIVANAMVKFNKILSTSTCLNKKDGDFDYISRVIYSGSRVPEWFKCKTPHASITVDLSSAPLSMDWGLLYCIVVSTSPASENIWIVCEDNIKISDDERVDEGIDDNDDAIDDEEWSLKRRSGSWRVDIRNFTSNHVYLWCDGALSSRVHRIKECRGASSSSKVSVELNFSYFIYEGRNQTQYMEIKECGACPTYSWEYQNFMAEMEKESQASTSQMGVGCSYYNKDEEETVPPMQKTKGFIFPRLPSATKWKNQTRGLKDIVDL